MSLDRDDKMFFIGSILGPIIVWWFVYGKRKYGMKGMK